MVAAVGVVLANSNKGTGNGNRSGRDNGNDNGIRKGSCNSTHCHDSSLNFSLSPEP